MILINGGTKTIKVPIPLTSTSSKIRVKTYYTFADYSLHAATKKVFFSDKHYIKWQIGYSCIVNKLDQSTCKGEKFYFIGVNKKQKTLYELSEYIYYFTKFGFIANSNLEYILKFLTKVNDDELIENKLKISRDNFTNTKIANVDFSQFSLNYPLLIHQFCIDNISEIIVKEKQRVIGIQTMLYFCFLISELIVDKPLINRSAKTKEIAYYEINKNNYKIFIDILKIFGILSHRYDAIEIIKILKLN